MYQHMDVCWPPFIGTDLFPPNLCNGLVRSDGSAFCLEIVPHYKVRCRFPASQPVSLITLGFHTLPDHDAYLPSTSSQLRCLQLEMTITCSVVVGCVFFFSSPIGNTLLVGKVEGRKVLSWYITPERCLSLFYFMIQFFSVLLYIYQMSVKYVCVCAYACVIMIYFC